MFWNEKINFDELTKMVMKSQYNNLIELMRMMKILFTITLKKNKQEFENEIKQNLGITLNGEKLTIHMTDNPFDLLKLFKHRVIIESFLTDINNYLLIRLLKSGKLYENIIHYFKENSGIGLNVFTGGVNRNIFIFDNVKYINLGWLGHCGGCSKIILSNEPVYRVQSLSTQYHIHCLEKE